MSMLDSSVRKNGHWRYILCSNANCAPGVLPCRFTKAATAAPNPYQPGSVSRHWPQLNPQGVARRSSIFWLALRAGGREPMLSSAISRIGVALKKYSVNPGVSYTSAREAAMLACESCPAAARKVLGAGLVGCSSVASSVAATRISRLRRAGPGGGGLGRLQQRGFERGGDQDFEVAAADLGVGVLGGDDLALLGQPDLPAHGA